MTIDERLERLADRHEALTQSVELLAIQGKETDRRISELSSEVSQTTKLVNKMAASIDTLGRIAEMHEHRLDSLENN